MMDERTQQLLNAELDGELVPAERLELDALLAARPELRQERDGLQGLARRLREAPDLDPPPDLARRVIALINLPSRLQPRRRAPHWAPSPMGLPFAALAAGLTAAVLTYWSIPDGPVADNSVRMVGSMVGVQARVGAEPQDSLAVTLDAISGQVTLGTSAEDRRILAFELNSANPVDIAVNLAGSGLQFDGFARGETGVDLVATDSEALHLRSEGARSFAVFLRGPDASPAAKLRIGLAFSEGEKALYRGALEAP